MHLYYTTLENAQFFIFFMHVLYAVHFDCIFSRYFYPTKLFLDFSILIISICKHKLCCQPFCSWLNLKIIFQILSYWIGINPLIFQFVENFEVFVFEYKMSKINEEIKIFMIKLDNFSTLNMHFIKLQKLRYSRSILWPLNMKTKILILH